MNVISTKVRKRDEAIKVAEDLISAAHGEGRILTAEERATVDAKMAEAREANATLEELDRERSLAAELATLRRTADASHQGVAELYRADGRRVAAKTLGEAFVESEAYRAVLAMPRTGAAWQGPAVELDGATLLGSGAGSGADLKLPENRPGILPLLFREMSLLSLIPTATTNASSVAYMLETTFTNAAAPRAEGAAAAESALVFSKVTEPVESIAHWLPVADEMLEDVAALRGFVDARLRLGMDLKIEDQALNGSGTSPALRGILNRSGLATMITRGTGVSPAGDTIVDAILRQITALTHTNLIMPDAIVIAPALWQKIALLKDTTGRYLGDGPWSSQSPRLWGLPVVQSPLMTSTDALVGAFSMSSQLFYRSGVAVDVSNSHSDYFTKMITAIRAVRRLGLAVYRPAGFGVVRDA